MHIHFKYSGRRGLAFLVQHCDLAGVTCCLNWRSAEAVAAMNEQGSVKKFMPIGQIITLPPSQKPLLEVDGG